MGLAGMDLDRRTLLRMLMGAPAMAAIAKARTGQALTGFLGAFSLASQDGSGATAPAAANPAGTDWSAAVIRTTMARQPDPARLGPWGYAISLYLYGQYLVYKRTGEKKYLDYIQGWVDSHVDTDGTIDRAINALDYMLPGNLLLVLWKETGQQKYKLAAQSIRLRLDTYPRTTDGGFWHATSRQHQLWLDGMYMSMPFLVRYGEAFHDQKYAYDEAAKQLLVYAKHLNDPASGLLYHAYDESGTQPWAQPVTRHSSVFWCRAIGWYGMALIEVLDTMPHHHAYRGQLIALVRQMADAYGKYQDSKTGEWYEVVDMGQLPANWLETSSSSMYTYTISRAVERGYVGKEHLAVATRGHAGVLSQVALDADGGAHIANICEGTNVSDLAYYLARPRRTDDFHGLGAFLIMQEQMVKKA